MKFLIYRIDGSESRHKRLKKRVFAQVSLAPEPTITCVEIQGMQCNLLVY